MNKPLTLLSAIVFFLALTVMLTIISVSIKALKHPTPAQVELHQGWAVIHTEPFDENGADVKFDGTSGSIIVTWHQKPKENK